MHPRWNSDETHYGFDEFGFSALPGGSRAGNGQFLSIGLNGSWWSSTESSSTLAYDMSLRSTRGDAHRFGSSKSVARSVRCIRE